MDGSLGLRLVREEEKVAKKFLKERSTDAGEDA